jgi:hypothetical protein
MDAGRVELPDAYYLPRDDDALESTVATTSPWDLWMDAATDISPHGRGVAYSTMSDHDGVLAHVAQPLLVTRR